MSPMTRAISYSAFADSFYTKSRLPCKAPMRRFAPASAENRSNRSPAPFPPWSPRPDRYNIAGWPSWKQRSGYWPGRIPAGFPRFPADRPTGYRDRGPEAGAFGCSRFLSGFPCAAGEPVFKIIQNGPVLAPDKVIYGEIVGDGLGLPGLHIPQQEFAPRASRNAGSAANGHVGVIGGRANAPLGKRLCARPLRA